MDRRCITGPDRPCAAERSDPLPRPYVLLSCAVSVDGYIDDTSPDRLLLSNPDDFDRVDAVRAESDAILIGAATLRRDNPRLLVNSPDRRAARAAHGKPAYPLKVTITAGGDLDPHLKFWHHGDAKIVYCPDDILGKVTEHIGSYATVSGTGPGATVDLGTVLDDLGARGIRKLMVEGGSRIHTQFLTEGLADEIQLAVAPFFVGQPDAPRFVEPATFPNDLHHRMTLADVRAVGDVALLRYLPKPHTNHGADPQPDVATGRREPNT
jgi:5-amino-6-(5-phosphoribosylamino)uracil reductase